MDKLGELTALAVAVLWSVAPFIFTSLVKKIDVGVLNIFRLIVAAVLLSTTLFIFQVKIDLNFLQIFFLSCSGLVGFVIGDTFLFKAFGMIGPRLGTLIFSCNPVISAIIAYFFLNEGLGIWQVLGMLITLSGILIVVSEKKPLINSHFKFTKKGAFYGFMAGVCQAVGLIFAKSAFLQGNINGMEATLFRILPSIIIMAVFLLIRGNYKEPVKALFKNKYWLFLMFSASFLGPYLGASLSFVSITLTQIGIASTLMATIPILMLPLSILVYKEKLSWRAIFGAVFTVLGVAVLFLL